MQVSLQNPKTGEIKDIKIGYSWPTFFFAGLFGLPLFIKGLHIYGVIMVVIRILFLSIFFGEGGLNFDSGEEIFLNLLKVLTFSFMELIIISYFALVANKDQAILLISNGWKFKDPDSTSAEYAKLRWNLSTRSVQAASTLAEPVSSGGTNLQSSIYQDLQKIGELRGQGILNDEEFALQKAKILSE